MARLPMPAMALSDLPEQLAFYGSYHRQWQNKVIHIIFVPLIWWSAVVAVCLVAPAPKDAKWSLVPVSGGAVVWLMYAAYYVVLDPVAGTVACVFYLCLYFLAERFAAAGCGPIEGTRAIALAAAAAHVLGWVMQIGPGHAYYEKRKPALLDSFAQSLLLAPLFVLMEVMFAAGYRPKLQEDVEKRIARRVAAWSRSGDGGRRGTNVRLRGGGGEQ